MGKMFEINQAAGHWTTKLKGVTTQGYSFVEDSNNKTYVLVYKTDALQPPIQLTTELNVSELLAVLNAIQEFEPVKTRLNAHQQQNDFIAQRSSPTIPQPQNHANPNTPQNPAVGE